MSLLSEFRKLFFLILITLLVQLTVLPVRAADTGEPYFGRLSSVQKMKERSVDSLVLVASGDRFYTLKNSKLYLYSFEPFQLRASKNLGFDTRQIEDDLYRSYLTSDEKRIILHSPSQIRVLEISTGNIIQRKNIKSQRGILNGDEFLLLDDENVAKIIDADTLRLKREFEVSEYDGWSGKLKSASEYNIIKAGKHLILFRPETSPYPGDVTVMDAMSYEIIWKIYHRGNYRAFLSYDNKKLYIKNPVRKIAYRGKEFDHRELYSKKTANQKLTFKNMIEIELGAFDWKYIQYKYIYNKNINFDGKVIPLRFRSVMLKPPGIHQQLSLDRKIWVLSGSVNNRFNYPALSRDYISFFYQFMNGEAVLYFPGTKRLIATPDARRYLKMKTSNGNIVPMDAVTFQKFNELPADAQAEYRKNSNR